MRLPGSVSERVVAAGYGLGWKALRSVPESVLQWAFEHGADVAVRRDGSGVAQLRKNLARVVPAAELERTVAAGMRSYARYWMETFRLPAMDVDLVLSQTHTDGVDGLDAALARGKGVVLALPHSGNWEVAGLWLVRHGYRFTTVAERLKPEQLYDRFVAYREGLGMQVIPLTGGASPTRVLLERLRAGDVVCLVADRDLSSRGIEVEFFGEPTRMPPGPAQLALATGASLFAVHTYYSAAPAGYRWGQWIGQQVNFGEGRKDEQIRRATQQLANTFAARIAGHPADWHMLQRLWLADL